MEAPSLQEVGSMLSSLSKTRHLIELILLQATVEMCGCVEESCPCNCFIIWAPTSSMEPDKNREGLRPILRSRNHDPSPDVTSLYGYELIIYDVGGF